MNTRYYIIRLGSIGVFAGFTPDNKIITHAIQASTNRVTPYDCQPCLVLHKNLNKTLYKIKLIEPRYSIMVCCLGDLLDMGRYVPVRTRKPKRAGNYPNGTLPTTNEELSIGNKIDSRSIGKRVP